VVLQSPYLVLSERGIDTLADAARRGVRVVLFTNSPTSAEGEITQAAFLKQWPQILARVPTARLYVRGVPGLMHAKSAIIDGQLAFVGSYNLDPISAHVNGEVVVVGWSRLLSHALKDLIDAQIGLGAPEVFEYRVARDASGEVVRDDKLEPVVAFGADDHCDPGMLAKVRAQDPVVALMTPLL
jgi:putative cardiolipin synthase